MHRFCLLPVLCSKKYLMAIVHHGFAGLACATLQRDLGSCRDFCGTTEGGVAGRAHWKLFFVSWKMLRDVDNGLFQQLTFVYSCQIYDAFGLMPRDNGMLCCCVGTEVKHRRRSYETWANCPLSFWQRRRLVWR